MTEAARARARRRRQRALSPSMQLVLHLLSVDRRKRGTPLDVLYDEYARIRRPDDLIYVIGAMENRGLVTVSTDNVIAMTEAGLARRSPRPE